jgi:phosphoserine aminotransferase
MMRKVNFNAGPAALPQEVLLEASQAVQDYNGTGLSILELPHRGPQFKAILQESNNLVRELCNIDANYEVLWLQGGGRMQFTMLPMNFLPSNGAVAYMDSGHWANEAIAYARYYGQVDVLGSTRHVLYQHLPAWPFDIGNHYSYVHYTTNNTIYGTQFFEIPGASVPIVGDMSSDIYCMKRDYTKYAMFYAAAQKNLGTPGLSLVVIHRDFLATAHPNLPPMLSYKAHVQEGGVLNTANVSGIYISLLMLRWLKAKGIDSIEDNNRRKAALLYGRLDNSSVFKPCVTQPEHRSLMNVTFSIVDKDLEARFVALCEANGVLGIEGHRSIGGFRVSLYNAIELSDVETLVQLMQEFERTV